MSLKTTLEDAAKHALKNHEPFLLSVFRMALAAIQNQEIEKRGKTGSADLTDEEVAAVLRSEVKKRHDAAAEFEKGKRPDLAEKELKEAAMLGKYLPAELSDDEIEKIVREVIGQLGPMAEKDFGRVMGEVMKRIKGQASGEKVNGVVRRCLAG